MVNPLHIPMLLAQTGRDAPSWLDWLLGLSRVSWGDGAATLEWRYPLPAWAWAGIALLAFGAAGWSYHRLLGKQWLRVTLACLRGLALLAVALVLAGPQLVRVDTQIEPDWLLVLVDRSASLQVQDGQPDQPGDTPRSRDAILRAALAEQADVFGGSGLGAERRVLWLGFGGQSFEVDPADLTDATAAATHLRTAIEQALELAAGRPISGIVLMTDGRSPQSTGPELVRKLEQQAVSVFAVPLGSEDLPLDLTFAQIDMPRNAFAGDLAPVRVQLDRLGGQEAVDPARVTVRLVNTLTGDVLDEKTLASALAEAGDAAPDDPFTQPIRLAARSETVGRTPWEVQVDYRPIGGEGRELVTTNNSRPIEIDVIDRPIRVLYIDGYPRWEFRYVKNLLLREDSISSSTLLLSADRAFAQEGDMPITRPPNTAEEMARYDVIMLGDVPPDYFSARQIALMRDHVAVGGAGLIWLGGWRHTPVSYEGTPLADLLPMRDAASVVRLDPAEGDASLEPTPAAGRLSILQLKGPEADFASPSDTWPNDLPALRWAQRMGPLKPTAEVLADAPNLRGDDGEPLPLVARLRYGRGQALYLATDETWRWRYGRGEVYFEQFWIQLIRMLGRGRVQQLGEQARLTLSHRRIQLGQTLTAELELRDPALIARQLARVRATVHQAGQPDAPPIDTLTLRLDTPANGQTNGDTTPRLTYRTLWQPAIGGQLLVRIDEPALSGLELVEAVEVIAPEDERRQPQVDHQRLAALASQTRGEVVPLSQLGKLIDLVPNRARKTPNDVREDLWNSPLSLIVILTLLTLEWVGRKLIRLV